jgi:hypothetical protein
MIRTSLCLTFPMRALSAALSPAVDGVVPHNR